MNKGEREFVNEWLLEAIICGTLVIDKTVAPPGSKVEHYYKVIDIGTIQISSEYAHEFLGTNDDTLHHNGELIGIYTDPNMLERDLVKAYNYVHNN